MNSRIILLNCNSLCSKLSEIKNLVDNEKTELICLTETWLTKHEPKFKNYTPKKNKKHVTFLKST